MLEIISIHKNLPWLSQLSVHSFSCVQLFKTPWTAACQASLSITNCWSLSIESVIPSKHFILCCPLFLLPSTFPSIKVLSEESFLFIRWPKYLSFSFTVLPKNIQDRFPLGMTDLISVQSKGLSRVFSNTTVQKHQFFGTQLSLWFNSHIHTWILEKLQFKNINFLAHSFLYGLTITSIHGYWKNYSSKASILWCSIIFIVQMSHPFMTNGKTIALTRQTFVDKVMSLLFNMLSWLVITFLPGSKCLLISWLQ